MPRWLLPLLCVLFFCSGICALIYQVMWLRLLALVFGVTVYAASTVLASFMGGLAIGSYAAGRVASRLRSPLRAFGLVEIGVGVSALATPIVLEGVKHVWITLQPSLPSSLLFLTIVRFVAAFAVLIVPTTLMGATLPIVMRSALASDTSVGSRMGLLYAVNTAGAIAGALTAGFYLVSELGVVRSFQIAALLNTLIGVVAIAASRAMTAPRVPTEVARTEVAAKDQPSRRIWRVPLRLASGGVDRMEVARTEVAATEVARTEVAAKDQPSRRVWRVPLRLASGGVGRSGDGAAEIAEPGGRRARTEVSAEDQPSRRVWRVPLRLPSGGGGSSSDAVAEIPSVAQRRAVLWTFVLSGVLSLALEIVWFRMLVTLLRPTAYAFTIMLGAVLAGIAIGSAVAARLLRRERPWLAVLTVVQLAIGLAAVLSLNVLGHLQAVSRWVVPALTAVGIDPYLGPIIVASLAAMLPTTLLLGLAFPIGLALWAGDGSESPRRIGVFYSLNVCGAIAGSLLGGFVLLPLLGSRGSLIATSALAVLSSVLLAGAQWRTRPNFAGFLVIVGPTAFVMAALNAVDPFAIIGAAAHRGERVLWREEGVQTTVAVHEQEQGGRTQRVMYLDGMHQASDQRTMTFVHHRIGAMPVMLHPSPTDVLVVGLGGGATAGAAARFPGVSVDVVELSRSVVAGASFFRHINFDLLQRPNATLRVDDGRNYLLTTRKRYDVVTADIILPRHAGAGALYSRQYFELVRGALRDNGLVLQWNGAETDTGYRLILRTFMSVFPETTLWADGTLMLGSKTPFEFSRSAYERRYRDPAFRELFDWDYDTLLRTYLAGPDAIRAWLGEGPILTDDRPVIEYFLSLPKNDPPPDLSALKPRPADIMRP
jgi:spermidine synthase